MQTKSHDIAQVVEVTQQLTGALGVVFLERDNEKRLNVNDELYCPANLTHLTSLMQHVLRLSTVAAAEGVPQAGTTEGDGKLLVVAVPVYGNSIGTEALAVAVSVESPAQAQATSAYLIQVLTWVAAYITVLQNSSGQPSGISGNLDLAGLSASIAHSAATSTSQARYRQYADWLNDRLNTDQVLFGFRPSENGLCRVAGYSGHDSFDRRSDWIGIVEEVLNETLVLDGTENGSELQNTHATDQLHRISGQHVVRQARCCTMQKGSRSAHSLACQR